MHLRRVFTRFGLFGGLVYMCVVYVYAYVCVLHVCIRTCVHVCAYVCAEATHMSVKYSTVDDNVL